VVAELLSVVVETHMEQVFTNTGPQEVLGNGWVPKR